ncbi:MAG TPA: class I SAM-dependent methyltransferase, partial [Blastocatellia bacterium]|nr:class I SAM-dependent methyltransferase [Blastocatellia bacterium]
MIGQSGITYPIRNGIPRFVTTDNYAAAFGLQWLKFAQTQLDSYTGAPLSEMRLERCLGEPLSNLQGKNVLEAGSGAGRFTE